MLAHDSQWPKELFEELRNTLGGLVQRWPHPPPKNGFLPFDNGTYLRLVRLHSPTRWGAPQRDVQGAPMWGNGMKTEMGTWGNGFETGSIWGNRGNVTLDFYPFLRWCEKDDETWCHYRKTGWFWVDFDISLWCHMIEPKWSWRRIGCNRHCNVVMHEEKK